MNPAYAEVPGYRHGYLMFPENRENEVLIVAVFEDRDAYAAENVFWVPEPARWP